MYFYVCGLILIRVHPTKTSAKAVGAGACIKKKWTYVDNRHMVQAEEDIHF